MNGILFKPWKIKAIAEDDREWQTRRLGGLKEINQEPAKWILYDFHSAHGVVTHTNKPNSKGQFIFWQAPIFDSPDGSYKYIKPRYQVGEVVYIKEKYKLDTLAGVGANEEFLLTYHPHSSISSNLSNWFKMNEVNPKPPFKFGKWVSPLFMPEWAARYFIKITDIRAERLQEITDTDCEKEGLENPCGYYCDVSVGHVDHQGTINNFAKLWDSINPKYPWAINPWVFVYSFKKAEK